MSPLPAARPPKARVRTFWPHSACFWGRERVPGNDKLLDIWPVITQASPYAGKEVGVGVLCRAHLLQVLVR
jgi:hypothetical protein